MKEEGRKGEKRGGTNKSKVKSQTSVTAESGN